MLDTFDDQLLFWLYDLFLNGRITVVLKFLLFCVITVVLVTGASGYIASHIVKQLQEEGYRVRGTVRSLENETKVKPLQELVPEAEHKLELVEADLTNEECWEG